MKGKKIVSTLLALLLLASLPVSALAAEWDISKGDITVNAGSGGQTVTQGGGAAVEDSAPVITGSSQDNTLTINAEKDQTASVTLSGVNIDVSGEERPPFPQTARAMSASSWTATARSRAVKSMPALKRTTAAA